MKGTSAHVALELTHVEPVDQRSGTRKADGVWHFWERAGQRHDALKRVAQTPECRLLFLVGVPATGADAWIPVSPSARCMDTSAPRRGRPHPEGRGWYGKIESRNQLQTAKAYFFSELCKVYSTKNDLLTPQWAREMAVTSPFFFYTGGGRAKRPSHTSQRSAAPAVAAKMVAARQGRWRRRGGLIRPRAASTIPAER